MADVPQWADLESKLPHDLADTQRDAVRDSFFHNTLWPSLVSRGADPMQFSSTYQKFMADTQRADKASYPRLKVAGAAALKGLAAPVAAILPDKDAKGYLDTLSAIEANQVKEANRQGINPWGSEMVGNLAGAAPWFAGAMAIPGMQGLGPVAANALIGGAYEAAASKPGERMENAALGAAGGAVLGRVFRGLHGKGPVDIPADAENIAVRAASTPETAAVPGGTSTLPVSLDSVAGRAPSWMEIARPTLNPKDFEVPAVATRAGLDPKLGIPPSLVDDLGEQGAQEFVAAAQAQQAAAAQRFATMDAGESIKSNLAGLERRSDVPVAIEKFRDKTGVPKEQFDQAMLDLYAKGDVALYRHDAPYLLPDAERNMLVRDPARDWYYNGVSWQEGREPRYSTGSESPAGTPIAARERPATGLQSYTGGEPIPGVSGDVSAVTTPEGTTYRTLSRDTVAHESLHRMAIQALPDPEGILGSVDPPMTAALRNALPAEHLTPGGNYSFHPNEEVTARLLTAVRTGDESAIQRFVDADGGRDQVLDHAVKLGRTLQGEVAKLPDSPMRTASIERLQHTVRRAQRSIAELQRDAAMAGHDLQARDGMLYFRTAGEKGYRAFSDKAALLDHMDKTQAFPADAPEFVSLADAIPGTPAPPPTGGPNSARYATDSAPAPVASDAARPRSGFSWFSHFVRPTLPWLASVSEKMGDTTLYDKATDLFRAMHNMDAYLEPRAKQIVAWGKGIGGERLKDMVQYQRRLRYAAANGLDVEAERTRLNGMYNWSPKELAKIDEMKGMYSKFGDEFGIPLERWEDEYIPKFQTKDFDPDAFVKSNPNIPKEIKAFFDEVASKTLDPRDENAANLLWQYVRIGAKQRYVNDAYMAMADAIKGEKVPENLKGELKRWLGMIYGIPDASHKAANSAIQTMLENMNAGIRAYNSKVPKTLRFGELTENPNEALNKFVMLQYAGGMGGRPATLIRDSLQFLLAYPMLGEKHLMAGIADAMSGKMYATAKAAGALAHDTQMLNAWGGQETSPLLTGAAKIGEKMLVPNRMTSNFTRLVVFSGALRKINSALPVLLEDGNPAKFFRKSGLLYLDKPMRLRFAQEFAAAAGDKAALSKVAQEAAAQMTHITQWSFQKGAQPGIYNTRLGRIFGQYGTWPMNYVEYMRRLGRPLLEGDGADRLEAMKAMSRFAIYNTALLKMGEAFGIDTGQWVFTQPGAYAGGPQFQAATNIYQAMDLESQRGRDARKELLAPAQMMVPGALQMESLYKAITGPDDEAFRRALGFVPMTPAKEKSTMHTMSSYLGGESQ